MADEIINRVANSPLITLDLKEYYPSEELVIIDVKNQLFKGLILKEKDFRMFIKSTDWSMYHHKNVGIYCSTDAVVPYWAYMLLADALQPHASFVSFGNKDTLESLLSKKAFALLDVDSLKGKKVVIKGCGDSYIPIAAYVEITRLLAPVVQSLMYGEPCSTVPIFKRKKV